MLAKQTTKMSFSVLFLLPMINKCALKPKSCINEITTFLLSTQLGMSSFTSFESVIYSRSCKLMWTSLRTHLLFLFNSVFFAITNLQTLGDREPGIPPFLCIRQLFVAATFIPLVLNFSILSQW